MFAFFEFPQTLFPDAEKIPAIIFRAYILTEAGAVEVNMARKIIKPVFSRSREISLRVLSQEDELAHQRLSTPNVRHKRFLSVRSEYSHR